MSYSRPRWLSRRSSFPRRPCFSYCLSPQPTLRSYIRKTLSRTCTGAYSTRTAASFGRTRRPSSQRSRSSILHFPWNRSCYYTAGGRFNYSYSPACYAGGLPRLWTVSFRCTNQYGGSRWCARLTWSGVAGACNPLAFRQCSNSHASQSALLHAHWRT